MRAFVAVQAKGSGDRIEDLGRHIDLTALLEPGVPSHPHTRELCDFLSSQPGSAPSPAAGKADIVRL